MSDNLKIAKNLAIPINIKKTNSKNLSSSINIKNPNSNNLAIPINIKNPSSKYLKVKKDIEIIKNSTYEKQTPVIEASYPSQALNFAALSGGTANKIPEMKDTSAFKQKYEGKSYDEMNEISKLPFSTQSEEGKFVKATAEQHATSADWKKKIDDINAELESFKNTDFASMPTKERNKTVLEYQEKGKELTKQREEYEAKYRAAKYNEEYPVKYAEYLKLMGNEDFDEKSKAITKDKSFFEKHFKDQSLYDLINDIDDSRKSVVENSTGNDTNTRQLALIERMNNDEIKVYNYIHSTQGEDKAKEYFDFLEQELNFRMGDEMYEKTKDSIVGKQVLAAVSGGSSYVEGIAGNFHDDLSVSATQLAASQVREELSGVEGTVFDLSQTIGNMAPSILISSATGQLLGAAGLSAKAVQTISGAVGSGSMGLSAAGNAYQEALRQGRTESQARAYSTLIGASEASLQYALGGISKLGGKALGKIAPKIAAVDKAAYRIAAKYGGSMASEGIEEGLQEVLTPIFESAIYNEEYDAADIEDIAYSAFLGAITGAVFETPEIIGSEMDIRRGNRVTDSLMTSETRNTVNDLDKKSDIVKGARNILNYAVKSEVLKSGTTKQAALDAMSEQNITPSAAAMDRIEKATGIHYIHALGLGEGSISSIEATIDKLDTAFAAAWYGTDGIKSARSAAELYTKAAAVGDAVSAASIANRINNEALSDSQAKRLIKKAEKLLPSAYSVDTKTGTNEDIANRIIDAAGNYISNVSERVADASQNYLSDIAEDMNSAFSELGAELSQDARSALTDLLTNGNVGKNLNNVLSDPAATDVLSRILGTHIEHNSTIRSVERKVKNMLSAYKSGNGAQYSTVAKVKHIKMNSVEFQLESAGLNTKEMLDAFRNAVYNGKLTEKQAKLIASYDDSFNLFVSSTAGRLDYNSTIGDMIDAAALVAGFDISKNPELFYDKGITEVIESENLPADAAGLYDADTGTVVVNKNAELSKQLGYRLAREILTEQNKSANINSKGVEQNGSTNTELLAGKRVSTVSGRNNSIRKYSANSAKMASLVEKSQDEHGYSAGDDSWLRIGGKTASLSEMGLDEGILRSLSRTPIKSTDTIGRVLSPKLQKKLENSFCKNFDGTIISLYHWTKNIFSEFSIGDIGFHFGTLDAASKIRKVKFTDSTPSVYKEVYFTGSSPLILDGDPGTWSIHYIQKEFEIFSDVEIKRLEKHSENAIKYGKYGSPIIKEFHNILKEKGYDSIVYFNAVEGDISVIAFYPDQIITVAENGVDIIDTSTYGEEQSSNDSSSDNSKSSGNNSKNLADKVLDYVEKYIHDVDGLFSKASKKYKNYMMEHRERLGSLSLSAENLNREVAAEYLTELFTNADTMEACAQNDLEFMVEIAEQVKTFADDTNDITLANFANSVYGNMFEIMNKGERARELQAVLTRRRNIGLPTAHLDETSNEGLIHFEEPEKETLRTRLRNLYNSGRRAVVDSGEAIDRLSKKLGNKTIYHMYNNLKQAKQTINYMLTEKQVDIEGNVLGESLEHIFKPIIKNQDKYALFCKYMQHLNNSERALHDKAIFVDKSHDDSVSLAKMWEAGNPEFKTWREKIYKYMDGLLQWQLDSGLISYDQMQDMKATNKYYVPALRYNDPRLDKPFFDESVDVNKTVQRAKGGAEGDLIPLLDSITFKTNQIINEARMNLLANEIIETLRKKGLLIDTPEGYRVADPALQEYVYSVTAIKNSDKFAPQQINGVYVTPMAQRDLKNAIFDLIMFGEGNKNLGRELVTKYARKVTLNEEISAKSLNELVDAIAELDKNAESVKTELKDKIKELSEAAVKAAHVERESIKQDAKAYSFATYDNNSSDNFSFGSDQGGNRMAFYIDGIRYNADIGKALFEGLKYINGNYPAKELANAMQKINTPYKKLITTYNFFFGLKNGIRDLQDAILFSSNSRKLLYKLLSGKAYKEIITNGEMWQLYKSLGGVGSSYFDFDEQIKLDVDDSNKGKLKKASEWIPAKMEFLNQMIEQAPRLAEFMVLMEEGDGSYGSKLRALHGAADVTVNFGRSGIYGKFINSTLVPFFNPSVQGASRFIRLFTETKGVKKWVFLVGKLLTLGFGAGLINELINGDDEDYEQLTDYQKQNNYLFKIGDGRFLKIPKGRNFSMLGILGKAGVDALTGKEVDMWGVIKASVEQISPNNPITDNIAMPLVLGLSGKTWYGADIESAADANKPADQIYDETTDYLSRFLGKVLNYSPKRIHYILDAYSGAIGDYVLPILTPKGSGDVFENILLTAGSNFIVDGKSSNRVSSDFYSLIDNLQTEKNDITVEDDTAAAVAYRFMNSQNDAIRDLYDEISAVNGGDLSPNEKAAKTRELKATIAGIMLNAMETEKEIYEVAANIESKYAYKSGNTYKDEVGDEITYDRYIDIVTREVNREVLGAEYALKEYNADVYQKASEAVQGGATYDLYYDAYFDTKEVEGDIDYTKGTIKTGTQRKNRWEVIDSMDASELEKSALGKVIFDISTDKLTKANIAGISSYDYIEFISNTGAYSSDDDSTKREKVLAYINKMSLSSRQKDALYRLAGYSEKTIHNAPWH